MKKLSLFIASAVAVILTCFCVAGCTTPNPVGLWKFKEMSADAGGIKIRYEAGKTYMFGQLSFTEDSVILDVSADYTWTMTMALPDETPTTESGTWEAKRGKVYLYDQSGEAEVVTVSDNELTLSHEEDGMKYKIVLVLQLPTE